MKFKLKLMNEGKKMKVLNEVKDEEKFNLKMMIDD